MASISGTHLKMTDISLCVLCLLGEDAPHSPVAGHFHGHWEIAAGSTVKVKAARALSLGVASNNKEDKGNAAFPKDSFS